MSQEGFLVLLVTSNDVSEYFEVSSDAPIQIQEQVTPEDTKNPIRRCESELYPNVYDTFNACLKKNLGRRLSADTARVLFPQDTDRRGVWLASGPTLQTISPTGEIIDSTLMEKKIIYAIGENAGSYFDAYCFVKAQKQVLPVNRILKE
ncbi:MAG TPA: hypothetical protein VGT05_02385 [Patescibacteria group bacterium]|nr:hypothetical protein [Patescibacteria group bacterium]